LLAPLRARGVVLPSGHRSPDSRPSFAHSIAPAEAASYRRSSDSRQRSLAIVLAQAFEAFFFFTRFVAVAFAFLTAFGSCVAVHFVC
jgi:hypothetical protein